MNFKFKIANKKIQALAKAITKYEAQGYTVTTGDHELTAIKGIYKIWESYHDNGQKACILNFINDKLDGAQKRWYNNGQKAYICNYKNGKQDGKQEGWNEDGTETAAELWKDDKFIKNI